MGHEWASVSIVYISYDATVEVSSYDIDLLTACVLRYCPKARMHVSEVIEFNEYVLEGCVWGVVVRIVIQADVGRDQTTAWVISHRHGGRC